MNDINYRYSNDEIEALLKVKRANVLKNTGRKDWGAFMAQVIAWRLSYNPLRYKDYGPYWWAIKPILRQYGYAVGENEDNTVIRQIYCGKHDEATLLMGELFREDYLQTQFIGTHLFMLDNEDEQWELFDEEMEEGTRVLALSTVQAP